MDVNIYHIAERGCLSSVRVERERMNSGFNPAVDACGLGNQEVLAMGPSFYRPARTDSRVVEVLTCCAFMPPVVQDFQSSNLDEREVKGSTVVRLVPYCG